MKKDTVYLDTSVISAYYDERTKERQEITVKFWRDVLPHYNSFISEITSEELEKIKNENLKTQLKNLVRGIKELKQNERIINLAGTYIERGIFPEK